ncbi:MAG: hypothetical protein H7Z12_03710, partial [Rhodospirillaceae bacterium]|nr:hypothetical protein [Rhodospirillales bacterium]
MRQMFSVLTPEQARYSIETAQHFDGWRAASERARKCAGSMSWKIVGGRTYLVRTHDRRGGQISLGPRSPETEAVFEQFWRDKQDAALRLRNAETRLAELARMNVALRLGRLPRLVAWLLT